MIDLAIVGAGSAGISAGREASRRGLSSILLEAAERVGGRAHSIPYRGHALDLGAGWLHSGNRNPLVPLAEKLGFDIDRSPTPWRGQFRGLGFLPDEQRSAYEAFARFDEEVGNPQSDDIAANALPDGGDWNDFIEALSGYLNGTSLRNMSAKDYSAYSSASTECNWRCPRSYGSLIASLSSGLKIEHGFKVSGIEWDKNHVRLSSERGSIVAGAAILTVSTHVLSSGTICFSPAIDDHLEAATSLPLGHVEKLFFALDHAADFPNDAHIIGNPRSDQTGSYMLHPLGIPVVEGFFGGDWVREAGSDDLEAKTRDELGSLLGNAFAHRIRRVAASGWKDNPLFGGSYSFARPGRHDARLTLARPAAERIAFAGEACSSSDFSTVHGAWESGIAAVERLFGSTSSLRRC